LGRDGAQLHLNQSGHGWSDPVVLPAPFPSDRPEQVQVLDLLGTGTACLVWLAQLSGDSRSRMRYVDLMGGQKPHLLTRVANNLGAETEIQYAPSTKFYQADRQAGTPWTTRLAFPVHVVERVDTIDRISRNRSATFYAYHHGYFDPAEREFRGFGMVEQWDTQKFATLSADDWLPDAVNIEASSHVPPVHTKTWFHTGAYLEGAKISKHFEHEYHQETDGGEATRLADTVLPASAQSVQDQREACRALKGQVLRQEIYGLDDDEHDASAAGRPYSVSERNYTLELLQPAVNGAHAVLLAHPRETIDLHYERKLYDIGGRQLADPRVGHQLTLAVNEYGDVLKSVAIAYGRRHPEADAELEDRDRLKQKPLNPLITYTENDYTNAILEPDDYRAPLVSETRTYEISNLQPNPQPSQAAPQFTFTELATRLAQPFDSSQDLSYENIELRGADLTKPCRRLIERIQTRYRPDDFGASHNDAAALLDKGVLKSRALPGEAYKLAFTPGLLAKVYRRGSSPTAGLLPGDAAGLTALRDECGYRDLERDGHWWIPSGRAYCAPSSNPSPTDELGFARAHF